jgi:hypothetical protein
LSENQKTKVYANSEFRRELEAGPESEDTRFFQVGYELDQDLSEEAVRQRTKENTEKKPDDPLFLADTLDGKKSDALAGQGKSPE